jgi:hypothetical protein
MTVRSPRAPRRPAARPTAPDEERGAYTGIFGLGQISHANVDLVRPYRKVITANAIYRREIFE